MPVEYNRNVDFIKGFAMFLVVVGHSFFFSFGEYTSALTFKFLDSFQMPLFVAISGFLTGLKPLRFSLVKGIHYISSKAQRLLLPLILLPILYAIVLNPDMTDAYYFYVNCLLTSIMHGGYWFTLVLFEIFVFYLIFSAIQPLVNRKNNIILDLISFTIVYGLEYLCTMQLQELGDIYFTTLSLGKLKSLFPFFFIGFFVARYSFLKKLLYNDIFFAVIALVYVFTYAVVLKGAFDPGRFVIAILAMITVCNIIVRMAANKDGKVLRALQLIGKQSLPIYLIHYFFLPALPMIGAFLTTIPDPSRLFLTETILAAINASIVITVTLFTIKIIRTDKYLAFLCFGDRLKKKAFAQRVEEEA